MFEREIVRLTLSDGDREADQYRSQRIRLLRAIGLDHRLRIDGYVRRCFHARDQPLQCRNRIDRLIVRHRSSCFGNSFRRARQGRDCHCRGHITKRPRE